jgi:restriction system protein
MSKTWMVRAQRGDRLYELFKEHSIVAIGWHELGDLTSATTRNALVERIHKVWPGGKAQADAMAAGQLHRFRTEMKVGDGIVTYDPSRRVYLVGAITGDYRWSPSLDPENANMRDVAWKGEVSRDLLSLESRNSLGAISTLFLLPKDTADDLDRALATKAPASTAPASEAVNETEKDVLKDIEDRAFEFIKDKLVRLDWDQMQELVAGLLRSMGYKTRVSPSGPDRGKDIVAAPDGLGFESPRIVVEVSTGPARWAATRSEVFWRPAQG